MKSLTRLYPLFRPISNITPFTYRDSFTFLEKLEDLARSLKSIIDWGDLIEQLLETIHADLLKKISDLEDKHDSDIAEVNRHIEIVRSELLAEIAGATSGGMAFDPTTGVHRPIDDTISRLFDNVRVHANFVKDIDSAGMTVAELDDVVFNIPVRHFDLSPLDDTNDFLRS